MQEELPPADDPAEFQITIPEIPESSSSDDALDDDAGHDLDDHEDKVMETRSSGESDDSSPTLTMVDGSPIARHMPERKRSCLDVEKESEINDTKDKACK